MNPTEKNINFSEKKLAKNLVGSGISVHTHTHTHTHTQSFLKAKISQSNDCLRSGAAACATPQKHICSSQKPASIDLAGFFACALVAENPSARAENQSQTYGKLSALAETLSYPYGNLSAVAETLSQPYGKLPAGAKTLLQPYGTLSAVAETLSQPYGNLSASAETLSQRYGCFSAGAEILRKLYSPFSQSVFCPQTPLFQHQAGVERNLNTRIINLLK